MSSCFSRCLRVPIAIRAFYEAYLWILQTLLLTHPDLHPGLLTTIPVKGRGRQNDGPAPDLSVAIRDCLRPFGRLRAHATRQKRTVVEEFGYCRFWQPRIWLAAFGQMGKRQVLRDRVVGMAPVGAAAGSVTSGENDPASSQANAASRCVSGSGLARCSSRSRDRAVLGSGRLRSVVSI